MIMPCSRPQSTRQEEEGRSAEVGRIVSASEAREELKVGDLAVNKIWSDQES